jgi:hypothetical protein
MNKVTLSWRDAKELTSACRAYTARAKEGEFTISSRVVPSTGDKVWIILKPSTRFLLEFTLQENSTTGEKYVNWARVNGPKLEQDAFLKLAGSIYTIETTNEEAPEF